MNGSVIIYLASTYFALCFDVEYLIYSVFAMKTHCDIFKTILVVGINATTLIYEIY